MTGCVAMLALIAGTVSCLHLHMLVELHGQPGWVAALTPLSVDGMIVAASTTLLADSRSGGRGGVLPWALLVVASAASLAANVAVAEPTLTGRVIAAWPSFALIGAYELLMRQVRRGATVIARPGPQAVRRPTARTSASTSVSMRPGELNYLQVIAVWVLECGEPAGGAVRGSRDPIHPSSIQLRLERGEVVDVEVEDRSAWFGVSVADVISLVDD